MTRLSLKNKWGDIFFISSFLLKKSPCKRSSLFFFPANGLKNAQLLPERSYLLVIWISLQQVHRDSVTWVMMGIYLPLDFCLFCTGKNKFVNDKEKLNWSPLYVPLYINAKRNPHRYTVKMLNFCFIPVLLRAVCLILM